MYAGLHTLINLCPLADVLINVVLSLLLLNAAGFLDISQVRFSLWRTEPLPGSEGECLGSTGSSSSCAAMMVSTVMLICIGLSVSFVCYLQLVAHSVLTSG